MKKIRKTYSGVVPNGKVLNSRNNSQQDTYSSDYLNRTIPNTNDLGDIVVDDITCKNLCNKNNILNGYLDNNALSFVANEERKTLWIYCKPNTTYTISRKAGQRFTVASSIDVPSISTTFTKAINDNNASTITITTGPSDNYLAVWYYSSSDDSLTQEEILNTIQIEKGSVATDYVEHKEFSNKEVYSTNEQVIGTWVDGKPIYRKVIRTTTSSAINAIKTLDTIANLQEITKSNISWRTTDGFKYLTDNPSESPVVFINNSNNVIESHKVDCFNNATIVIILEYTKTTD